MFFSFNQLDISYGIANIGFGVASRHQGNLAETQVGDLFRYCGNVG